MFLLNDFSLTCVFVLLECFVVEVSKHSLLFEILDDIIDVSERRVAIRVIDFEELVDNLFAADFLSHERNDVISHLIELHNAVKLLGTLSYCYTHVDLPYRLENKLIF